MQQNAHAHRVDYADHVFGIMRCTEPRAPLTRAQIDEYKRLIRDRAWMDSRLREYCRDLAARMRAL